jgi:hypothetical protein
MPAKILKARLVDGEFQVAILLDDKQVAEDGTPDPAWVHESSWGANMKPDDCIREAGLLAALKLKRLCPPEPAQEVVYKAEGQEIKL